jgi:hypothetical protein
VEKVFFAMETELTAVRGEMAKALLRIPPIPPAVPTGVEVAFEGIAKIVDVEPNVDLLALLNLGTCSALARYGKSLRSAAG